MSYRQNIQTKIFPITKKLIRRQIKADLKKRGPSTTVRNS
jgi:hypothetical protein